VTQLLFLRGDGGFSAANGLSDPPPKSPPAVPDRPADYVVDLPTHAEAALIYRLSGDFNTLHVDPEIARAAGFNRPILHGLATLGIVGHALLKAVCDNDPAKLASLQVRFTSPVYPGETIRTEIWRENEQIRMRARAVERDVIVINNGLAYLR
jgi:acyl dehydratase